MPHFLHNLAFIGKGKPLTWQVTDGKERYTFSTNWDHDYPLRIVAPTRKETEEAKTRLEDLLNSYSIDFTTIINDPQTITITADKQAFDALELPKETEKAIEKKYVQQALWELGRYRKLSLDEEITSTLQEQNRINTAIQHLLEAQTEHYQPRIPEHDHETDFAEQFTTLPKPYREPLQDRLDHTLNAQPETEDERIIHEQLIKGIYAQGALLSAEHDALLNTRKLLKNPSAGGRHAAAAQAIKEAATKLAERLEGAGHRLSYDKNTLTYTAHLDIVRRKDGNIIINGIQLDESAQPMMETHDFLELSKAYYDIEKPQFDTWKEIISWCATIIDDEKTETRILDTDKHVPETGRGAALSRYTVRQHEHEHELTRAIAALVDPAYLHFIYNANYEAGQFRNEGNYRIDGKQPRKKASTESSIKDFMARWQISPWAEVIDWMKYSKIAKAHLPSHRLETYMNHQAARAGHEEIFKKIIDYEEMRECDRLATLLFSDEPDEEERKKAEEETLRLADYTVSDVDVMHDNMQLDVTIDDLFDVVDTAHTFGISLSQVTNNANTTRQLYEKRFWQRTGRHLDPLFFRDEHRAQIQRFKNSYTTLKIKTLNEAGLDIPFTKGLQREVDRYYFSPEINLARLIGHTYPEVEDYIERTLNTKDNERRMGRTQFVRSFIIPMLADYTELRKGKKILEKELRELQTKAQKKGDDLLNENLEGILTDLERRQDRDRTYMSDFKREVNRYLKRFERDEPHITTGRAKTIYHLLTTWRNKESFFRKLYNETPDNVETKMLETFQGAADTLKKAEVLQVEGKFIYVRGTIDEEEAAKHGLFKIQEGLTTYNLGRKEITFAHQGHYHGYPAKRPLATYHYPLFKLATEYAMLNNLLADDLEAALKKLSYSAKRLNELDDAVQHPEQGKNRQLVMSLLKHSRSKKQYYGFMDGEEQTFTEDDKHIFTPDVEHYQHTFQEKLYGLKENGRIDTKAPFAKLINASIPLNGKGTKKAAALYRKLITGNAEEQQASITELLARQRTETVEQLTLF